MMKKVIKGLQTCTSSDRGCNTCPYAEDGSYCTEFMMHDALEALYKKSCVPIKKGEHFICSACYTWIISNRFKYCPECGSAIEWSTEMYPGG